ncbi:MAG: hypothetical protein ACO1QB_06760 [Verrucomicrobiales bacterium]
MALQPTNHVDPPNIARMLNIKSPESPFWSETANSLAWLRYLWQGPTPQIKIELNEVYVGQRFSAQAIYESMIESVERLRLPGVRYGREVFRESGPLSDFRVYLKINRELSEFLVCAAPAGDSFFITVRKIDRFVHVKWFHYLLALMILPMPFLISLPFLTLIQSLAVWIVCLGSLASIMRLAASSQEGWLPDHLPEVPVLGALYLRWFRPDTFYRQDFHNAFLTLVSGAIKDVVAGLSEAQGIRPSTARQTAPVAANLL